jgi:hypothetical protein
MLAICTCTYLRMYWGALIDRSKTGLSGLAWKFARIGERASPYVAVCCAALAVTFLIA